MDDWPRSASKKEWFRITRELIQSLIADMDLDHDSLSQDKKVICSDVLKDTAAAIPAFVKICTHSWTITPWLSIFTMSTFGLY